MHLLPADQDPPPCAAAACRLSCPCRPLLAHKCRPVWIFFFPLMVHTAVNRSSLWRKAFENSAAAFAEALLHGLVSCFGWPAFVTLDQGTQFTLSLWAALCNLLGALITRLLPTTRSRMGWSNIFIGSSRMPCTARLSVLIVFLFFFHLPWVYLACGPLLRCLTHCCPQKFFTAPSLFSLASSSPLPSHCWRRLSWALSRTVSLVFLWGHYLQPCRCLAWTSPGCPGLSSRFHWPGCWLATFGSCLWLS